MDNDSKKEKGFKLDNVEKIIGTRNRIIHGYDKISDDLICSEFIFIYNFVDKQFQSLTLSRTFQIDQ